MATEVESTARFKSNPSSVYCQNCEDVLIMQEILREKGMQNRDEQAAHRTV